MVTEKRLLQRQVAPEHRHTNEDVLMLREWAVKVRCAGFPGIIPQVYKGCSSIAVHTSLSQHALSEHTGCYSELDPWDSLMNTKRVGKKTPFLAFWSGQRKKSDSPASIQWMIYTTQKRAEWLPRMKNQREWSPLAGSILCSFPISLPYHYLILPSTLNTMSC